MIQIENSSIDSQILHETRFDPDVLLKDGNILKNVVLRKKILSSLRYSYKKLYYEIDELALQKDKIGCYHIEQFNPFEILKRFSGIEIHNLQRVFDIFNTGITLKAFVLISLTLLDFKIELTPFVLMSLMGLYDILLNQNKPIANLKDKNNSKQEIGNVAFSDFLKMFIKNQVLLAQSKSSLVIEDWQKKKITYRVIYSKQQDVIHHDTPLRDAHYSEELGHLFCLDDNSNHIRVYSPNAELKFRIRPSKDKHKHQPMFINNFAWAENKKTLCFCMQDSTISFIDSNDFNFEICYSTTKLQLKIWYIEYCSKWFFIDTENQLSTWDEIGRKCNILPFPTTDKISDIIQLKSFKLIAISTFNRKVILWHPDRNKKILTFSLSESSATTLKYSECFNLFMSVGFDSTVKCYQYDLSNEFSRIGKLDHTSTITAIEVCDHHEIIITCDENRCLKIWNPNTLKSSQIIKVNSKNIASKILMLKRTNKFCILANRIQFYELYAMDNESDANKRIKILPCISFNRMYGILTLATHSDIRSFNIDYGVLVENDSFHNYGIKDKVKCIKYSRKNNWFCYSDAKGNIRQLIRTGNLYRPQEKFQPFPSETECGMIWVDKFELMIVWSKNTVKIYKYETHNTNSLLRQLELPEKCIINQVKLQKQTNTLAIIVNNTFAFLMDLRKFSKLGCLIFYQNSHENNEIIDGLPALGLGTLRQDQKPSKSAKHTKKILDSNKHSILETDFITARRESLHIHEQNLLAIQHHHSQYSHHSRHSHNSYPSRVNDNIKWDEIELNQVDNVCFVNDWSCVIVIYNEHYISITSFSLFIEHKSRIYLDLSELSASLNDELKYVVCKSKKLKIIKNKDMSNETVKDEYYLLLGDNKGRITLINITNILETYFTFDNKERIGQPYNICQEVINENEFKDYIGQQLKLQIGLANTKYNSVNLSSNEVRQWKAHDTEILNCKIIDYREILLISTTKDGNIKVWDINSNMLCHISLNDKRINKWNIVQNTLEKKIKNLIQVKEFIGELAEEFIEIKKDDEPKIQNLSRMKSRESFKKTPLQDKNLSLKENFTFSTFVDYNANSLKSSAKKNTLEVPIRKDSKQNTINKDAKLSPDNTNANSIKVNPNNTNEDYKPKEVRMRQSIFQRDNKKDKNDKNKNGEDKQQKLQLEKLAKITFKLEDYNEYSEYTKTLARKLEKIGVPKLDNVNIIETKKNARVSFVKPRKSLYIDLKTNQKAFHITSPLNHKDIQSSPNIESIQSCQTKLKQNKTEGFFNFAPKKSIKSNNYIKYFMERTKPNQTSYYMKTEISTQRIGSLNSLDLEEHLDTNYQQYSTKKIRETTSIRKIVLHDLELKKKKYKNMNNSPINSDFMNKNETLTDQNSPLNSNFTNKNNEPLTDDKYQNFKALPSPTLSNFDISARNNSLFPSIQKSLAYTGRLRIDTKLSSRDLIVNDQSTNYNYGSELSKTIEKQIKDEKEEIETFFISEGKDQKERDDTIFDQNNLLDTKLQRKFNNMFKDIKEYGIQESNYIPDSYKTEN